MGHFKSKRLNMVTWMHWMLANMAFIIVSNAKNLLMDNPTPPPPPLPPTPDHEAIGEIGGKYFHGMKCKQKWNKNKLLKEQERSVKMSMEFWQHNWMINNFNLYLKRKSFFSGKVACCG